MSGNIELKTTDLLFEWGKWARTEKPRLEAQGTLAKFCASRVTNYRINDDDAEAIDRIVAKLIFRDHEMGTAVKLYYMYEFNYRKIGARLKVSKDKAGQLVQSGVAWVDAALLYKNKDSQVA